VVAAEMAWGVSNACAAVALPLAYVAPPEYRLWALVMVLWRRAALADITASSFGGGGPAGAAGVAGEAGGAAGAVGLVGVAAGEGAGVAGVGAEAVAADGVAGAAVGAVVDAADGAAAVGLGLGTVAAGAVTGAVAGVGSGAGAVSGVGVVPAGAPGGAFWLMSQPPFNVFQGALKALPPSVMPDVLMFPRTVAFPVPVNARPVTPAYAFTKLSLATSTVA
jgi:hypothetical protein